MFNRNNIRYWSKENPRIVRQRNFQERFGFNVWIGMVGNTILRPIMFDGLLNGERYLSFLQNEVQERLDEMPLARIQQLHFQQDGAPPHNSRGVVEYLNQLFGERWIGTNGPIRWPPRSPDLTPLDFFLWGHIKNKVYSTVPTTLQDLKNRVINAVNDVTQDQLDRVLQATKERAILCRQQNGGHIEQLL